MAGSFLQALAGHGLAIAFDPDDPALAPLAGRPAGEAGAPAARWADELDDDAANDSDDDDSDDDDSDDDDSRGRAGRATDIPLRERLKTASKAEKIQLALHGSKPQRNLLIRDRDKSLHQYVIRNPKIGLDEVAAIARMSNVAPDVLAFIAGKREWFQRPDIASSLVRNPKVSAVVAKKLLVHVTNQELRQLAKGNGVREAIAQEARRRVLQKK